MDVVIDDMFGLPVVSHCIPPLSKARGEVIDGLSYSSSYEY